DSSRATSPATVERSRSRASPSSRWLASPRRASTLSTPNWTFVRPVPTSRAQTARCACWARRTRKPVWWARSIGTWGTRPSCTSGSCPCMRDARSEPAGRFAKLAAPDPLEQRRSPAPGRPAREVGRPAAHADSSGVLGRGPRAVGRLEHGERTVVLATPDALDVGEQGVDELGREVPERTAVVEVDRVDPHLAGAHPHGLARGHVASLRGADGRVPRLGREVAPLDV